MTKAKTKVRKLITISGHYRIVPDFANARYIEDPDNPANEVRLLPTKKIWIEEHQKWMEVNE